MSDKFNSHKLYKHIPHLTLVPPFKIDKDKEELLKSVLTDFNNVDTFDIQLDGFNRREFS